MQRNMELIRAILLDIESIPAGHIGKRSDNIEIADFQASEVQSHLRMLFSSTLIDAVEVGTDGEIVYRVSLTWAGHEFVDAAREPKRWNEARKQIVDKLGGASLNIYTGLLLESMKQNLGLA